MIDDPRGRAVTAQQVCDLLNEAAHLDADAIRSLVASRVYCNDALNAHATIQTGRCVNGGHCEVGILGILNGLFGTFADGWGCIHAVLDDDPAIRIRFEVRGRPQVETGE